MVILTAGALLGVKIWCLRAGHVPRLDAGR
jgi:hypothetical protein